MAGSPHHRRWSDGGIPAELGLRRVNFVLIVTGDSGPRCQVVGLGHRLPVRRTVPLSVAVALIAAGAPYAVRRGPAATATAAATAARPHPRRGERV